MSLYTADTRAPTLQDNDLWVSMAEVAVPGLTLAEYRMLRDEAVMEWALDMQTPKATLYDQYYLTKNLKQL